jgi:hypothetical protein
VAVALLDADGHAEVADAAAAARLRHEQGVETLAGRALAQGAALLLEGGEGPRLGDLLRVQGFLGRHLALDERADRIAEGDQLLWQLHDAHLGLASGSRRCPMDGPPAR